MQIWQGALVLLVVVIAATAAIYISNRRNKRGPDGSDHAPVDTPADDTKKK